MKTRFIDLHNDFLTEVSNINNYVKTAQNEGVDAILASVWTTKMSNPLEQIKKFRQLIDDTQTGVKLLLHIEDLWFLNEQNIDEFISYRPYSAGITWNKGNAFAGGAFCNKGLTRKGEALIRKLISKGIVIDLAHLNKKSFLQVAGIVKESVGAGKGRLFCSHTCFDEVHLHKRNLDREQIQAIVDSDGLVGLTFVNDFLCVGGHGNDCGLEAIYRHIKYFIDNFGADNLAVGTDFYGTANLPQGINGYDGVGNLAQYLADKEISGITIDKILWGNARRFIGGGVTYEEIMRKVDELGDLENVDMVTIGHSVMGEPIRAFHVGNRDENQIIVTGAIHAREWITALVIVELAKIMSERGIDSGGVFFIPLCNPDGVRLAVDENCDKMLWKANARGVDLNVNFDADWGTGAQNVSELGAENCIGPFPHSEPEVKALVDFTMNIKPRLTLAYHSKGELIYHNFESRDGSISKEQLLRTSRLAQKVGDITGYIPEKTKNSAGGYSDWVAMRLGVPALTIEVGNDDYSHPISIDRLPEILAQNKDVVQAMLEEVVTQ